MGGEWGVLGPRRRVDRGRHQRSSCVSRAFRWAERRRGGERGGRPRRGFRATLGRPRSSGPGFSWSGDWSEWSSAHLPSRFRRSRVGRQIRARSPRQVGGVGCGWRDQLSQQLRSCRRRCGERSNTDVVASWPQAVFRVRPRAKRPPPSLQRGSQLCGARRVRRACGGGGRKGTPRAGAGGGGWVRRRHKSGAPSGQAGPRAGGLRAALGRRCSLFGRQSRVGRETFQISKLCARPPTLANQLYFLISVSASATETRGMTCICLRVRITGVAGDRTNMGLGVRVSHKTWIVVILESLTT